VSILCVTPRCFSTELVCILDGNDLQKFAVCVLKNYT